MELLKLATGLRMSTDVRRAIFCVIMGSEDYLDAFNRLLGLPLKVCCSLCFNQLCIFVLRCSDCSGCHSYYSGCLKYLMFMSIVSVLCLISPNVFCQIVKDQLCFICWPTPISWFKDV